VKLKREARTITISNRRREIDKECGVTPIGKFAHPFYTGQYLIHFLLCFNVSLFLIFNFYAFHSPVQVCLFFFFFFFFFLFSFFFLTWVIMTRVTFRTTKKN
jgi:hypothetical protein